MKCILFDLDGTLLPLDNEVFTKAYLSALTNFCSSKIAPDKFLKYLMESTNQMIINESDLTNEDIFKKSFLKLCGLKEKEIFPHFERFYETDYLSLIDKTKPSPLAFDIVKGAVDKGYSIILATNAVFPKIAIEERMRWAGVDKLPWLGITSYEVTKGCKPNLRYYKYIIDTFRVSPESLWMIGNDTFEDMISKKLGFNTYLVTDFSTKYDKECPSPNEEGTLNDVLDFVINKLPVCQK